jgi:hypothetical protein
MAALNMRPYLAGRRGVMDQTSGVALSNLDLHSRPTNTPIVCFCAPLRHDTLADVRTDHAQVRCFAFYQPDHDSRPAERC